MSSTNFGFSYAFPLHTRQGGLSKTVELAACLCFDVIDDFFNAYIRVCNKTDRHMRTLVVRAVLGNFFGTRTQGSNRNHHFQAVAVHVPF